MSSLLVVAGPAGSGKTTVANDVAEKHCLPHLDFDIVTSRLVDEERARGNDENEAALLLRLKVERYRVFAAAVSTALTTNDVVIASAPFTSHLQSSASWADWVAQLPTGTTVTIAWLQIDPARRLVRLAERASTRDSQLIASTSVPEVDPPTVPHVSVAAEGTVEEISVAVALLLH